MLPTLVPQGDRLSMHSPIGLPAPQPQVLMDKCRVLHRRMDVSNIAAACLECLEVEAEAELELSDGNRAAWEKRYTDAHFAHFDKVILPHGPGDSNDSILEQGNRRAKRHCSGLGYRCIFRGGTNAPGASGPDVS